LACFYISEVMNRDAHVITVELHYPGMWKNTEDSFSIHDAVKLTWSNDLETIARFCESDYHRHVATKEDTDKVA
jgi:hypothetical protein